MRGGWRLAEGGGAPLIDLLIAFTLAFVLICALFTVLAAGERALAMYDDWITARLAAKRARRR